MPLQQMDGNTAEKKWWHDEEQEADYTDANEVESKLIKSP
jgi:hypothetical protein